MSASFLSHGDWHVVTDCLLLVLILLEHTEEFHVEFRASAELFSLKPSYVTISIEWMLFNHIIAWLCPYVNILILEYAHHVVKIAHNRSLVRAKDALHPA